MAVTADPALTPAMERALMAMEPGRWRTCRQIGTNGHTLYWIPWLVDRSTGLNGSPITYRLTPAGEAKRRELLEARSDG